MHFDADFKVKNMTMAAAFSESSQSIEAEMGMVGIVHDGQNGATFTPSVSAGGVLSWTNDRELPNPAPVNIRGKDGRDGIDGEDGYTPVKGKDYFDGQDGKDGYTPRKGVDYFDGQPGKDGVAGKDGYTPIKGKDYFDGQPGKDGYTPIKGVDYFTDTDKQEMVAAVVAALPVETWVFTMEDGTETTKEVVIA